MSTIEYQSDRMPQETNSMASYNKANSTTSRGSGARLVPSRFLSNIYNDNKTQAASDDQQHKATDFLKYGQKEAYL